LKADNEIDVRLLREDPGKLLIRYQPVIRFIVRNLAYQGYLPRRDIVDLTQDVNRKLVERMPRIRDQYTGKCLFRTYFCVVIRNLCLEEFRKVRLVAEPRAELYENTAPEAASDPLVIRQEFERLQRALRLFGAESQPVWIVLRCFAGLPVTANDFSGLAGQTELADREHMAESVNQTLNLQKRDKIEILATLLTPYFPRARTPEAFRKWTSSRLDELLSLMNGRPPKSAYTLEILYILLEKSEIAENNE
jgi:RNA polymerase sigma factor (sigma-70 family)